LCLVAFAMHCGGAPFTGESPDGGDDPAPDSSVPPSDGATGDATALDAETHKDAQDEQDAHGSDSGGQADSGKGGPDAGHDAGPADGSVADASHPDASSDGGKCILCGTDTTCCPTNCCTSVNLMSTPYCPVSGSGSGNTTMIVECPLDTSP